MSSVEQMGGIQRYPFSPHSLSSCVSQKFLPYSEQFIKYRQIYLLSLVPAKAGWLSGTQKGLLPWVGGWNTWLQKSIPTPISLKCDQVLSKIQTQGIVHGPVTWKMSAFLSGSSHGQPHLDYLVKDKLQKALLAGHISVAINTRSSK